MEDFLDDILSDEPEAPCEICGISFPLQLLIEHELLVHHDQGFGVDPFDSFFSHSENEPPSSAKSTDLFEALVDTVKETLQGSSLLESPSIKETDEKEGRTNQESEEKSVEKIAEEKPADTSRVQYAEPELLYEESIPEENGTKIMTYGTNKIKNENVKIEKPTYKIPTLLHMNNADLGTYQQAETCFISDDDDDDESEYLEDFWKRAEIKLSEKLKKTIKL